MEYRKDGSIILLRVDKDEESWEKTLETCRIENIYGAVFSGIGACGKAVTSSYIPEKSDFTDHVAEGLLELVSLTGNISCEDGQPVEHTHALFSYLDEVGEQKMLAGHLKKAVVSYNAEITIQVTETMIGKKKDPATGIMIWDITEK